MHKLFLLEDDVCIQVGVQSFFENEGFQVDIFETIESANQVSFTDYDCLLVDWNLPDGVGIDLIRGVREVNSHLPILILSARTDLMDKIIGLEVGADDYVLKPYEPRELLARVRAHIRKSEKLNSSKVEEVKGLVFEDFEILVEQRRVLFKGNEVNLAKIEFDLLLFLSNGINKVYSRDEILSNVWGYSYPTTRTVDTHIQKLRKKFGNDFFQTIHGVGYLFDPRVMNNE
jgi:DNA-binding response OmpR family regulator